MAGHWAEATVQAAVNAGLVNGYPDGSYRPNEAVTRIQFIKLMTQVQGSIRWPDGRWEEGASWETQVNPDGAMTDRALLVSPRHRSWVAGTVELKAKVGDEFLVDWWFFITLTRAAAMFDPVNQILALKQE